MRPVGGLPTGYTRLEYLCCTSTQYIDTGIKLSDDSRVICEFSDVRSGDGMIFGARQDLLKQAFCATATTYYPCYGSSSGRMADGVTKGKLDANKNKWTMNEVVSTFVKESFETPVSSLLFAIQTPASIDGRHLIGNIHSFSISRDGQLQLNFIPCLDPTGKPCMFDMVTRKPFYNAAKTGPDFLYG